MDIDSKTRESHTRAALFILAASGMSIAIAWGILSARQGEIVTTFLSVFLAWNGYLLAHYAETGRFIDPRQNEPAFPLNRSEMVLAGIGIATLLAGIGIKAIAIAETDFFLASIGASVLMAGYLIAHYAMTDLLL